MPLLAASAVPLAFVAHRGLDRAGIVREVSPPLPRAYVVLRADKREYFVWHVHGTDGKVLARCHDARTRLPVAQSSPTRRSRRCS